MRPDHNPGRQEREMQVWSNMSPTREEYVEIQLCGRTAIRVRGRAEVGWSVSSHVFSRESQYDALVSVSRCFEMKHGADAMEYVQSLAVKHGLKEDVGRRHSRRLWSV